MVHADNGKDFRSYLIRDTLDEHDIRYAFRPPKTPHYGGHIERLAGTLGKKVHALPGATFSNPKQRGEYKSEAKAKMTLRELQPWLVNLIVGVYHNRVHDGIGCPPIARWNEGIPARMMTFAATKNVHLTIIQCANRDRLGRFGVRLRPRRVTQGRHSRQQPHQPSL